MTSSSLSDVELTIELSTEIESALVARGATGSGLRDKAMCFEAYLPSHFWKALRTVGLERNHISHVHRGALSDREGYVRACALVMRAIRAIPADAVASLPPARPGFRGPVRGATPDRQSLHGSAWQFAYGAAENHVRRKVRRKVTSIAGFFIVAGVGLLFILIAGALSSTVSRKGEAAETKASLPAVDTSIDPLTTTRFGSAPDSHDRIGARSTDVGRYQSKPTKAVAGGAPGRSPARVAHPSTPSDDAPAALPLTALDALPSLQATDGSGQRAGINADLALGKLAAPPTQQRDAARASAASKSGNVDLRSQDLESF